ncbi:MAG TPA: LPS biosynthesis protein WbpP [Bacteroidales bacterium]|nr:LPS biosynthesis protein WbpP [Bacteroidales bacterium]
MKVLVTGGAGFIGSNLCERLVKEKYDVVCLDNFITGKRENIKDLLNKEKFRLIEGDIRDYETCLKATSGVDMVLHEAALGSVPRSIENPLLTHQCNVDGFVNMLNASRENNVERFIYASSSSVYGDSDVLPRVEDKIGKPLSPYAVTKLTNELYANNFASVYGMKVIGFRYFNVFGKNQDPDSPYAAVIPRFIKALLNGQSPVIYGDGETTRDFCYVDNVVEANLLAMKTDNPEAFGKVYNVGAGKQTSLNDLFKLIKASLIDIYETNGSKGRIDQIKSIEPIYDSFRKGDVRHSLASIKSLSERVGYIPIINLYDGMRLTCDFFARLS